MLPVLFIPFLLQIVNGFRGNFSVNQSDVPWLVFIRTIYKVPMTKPQQSVLTCTKSLFFRKFDSRDGAEGIDKDLDPANVDNREIMKLHGPLCTGVIISEKLVISSAFCINTVSTLPFCCFDSKLMLADALDYYIVLPDNKSAIRIPSDLEGSW